MHPPSLLVQAVSALTTERDEVAEESRACSLLVETLAASNDEKERKIERLQTAIRSLWSVQQAALQKADEMSGLAKESSGILETLQDMLEEGMPRQLDVDQPNYT